jgi:hypothetical protein
VEIALKSETWEECGNEKGKQEGNAEGREEQVEAAISRSAGGGNCAVRPPAICG